MLLRGLRKAGGIMEGFRYDFHLVFSGGETWDGRRFFSGAFPKLPGRHPGGFFENLRKIILRGKSGRFRNLGDGIIGGFQQMFAVFHPFAQQVVNGRNSIGGGKLMGKVKLIPVSHGSQLLQGKRFLEMSIQIMTDFLTFVRNTGRRRDGEGLAGNPAYLQQENGQIMLADLFVGGVFSIQFFQNDLKQRQNGFPMGMDGKDFIGKQAGVLSETELKVIDSQDNIPHIFREGRALRVTESGIHHNQLILPERQSLLFRAEESLSARDIENLCAVVGVKYSVPVRTVSGGGYVTKPAFPVILGKICEGIRKTGHGSLPDSGGCGRFSFSIEGKRFYCKKNREFTARYLIFVTKEP